MVTIRADIFAWIPQPDVPNPLFLAAERSDAFKRSAGPGTCGSRFGGDNFRYPPRTPEGWHSLTFRAKRSVEFSFEKFGKTPKISKDDGVKPGFTTVLTDERAKGGTICHSIMASVRSSDKATVEWCPTDGWYELKFCGEVQDPVPSDVARTIVSKNYKGAAAEAAALATPNLAWDLCLRFQLGNKLPLGAKAQYALHGAYTLDCAEQFLGKKEKIEEVKNLVHGTVGIRQFPSYAIYITCLESPKKPDSELAYFADASNRFAALGRIILSTTDVLRPMSW